MHFLQKTIPVVLVLAAFSLAAQVPQIHIPRVELMLNQPAPYNVRDWRQVALRYDSFVYDLQKTGQYLPLVYIQPSGLNYPQNKSFGLHTYVGTNTPQGNEAINVLPSLVGATLAGADKSDQFGENWLLMSQDFFNANNGEGIYLNNRSGGSGGDWWYDLMPNVYFYQLYDLYPDAGGAADFQFLAVADRFLASVQALGGSATPWQKANMNYRAFNFKTMQPNANGVKEPEAAGAYAWVLYNAYRHSGNPAYLQGAEWSLEFLNEWDTNPSYELQLPYGIYTAARMNAELGTRYDVEKMVNWSFDRGPLRGWGAIVGSWGGFDVSGLIGEANDNGNDYAFQMNGVQQAAMLVPMLRYDKRFARAIGKWVLNLANATRLFYPGFLPGSLQDASAWSNANDPDRVIGYEALREKWQNQSPYSTGDALKAGWAATNLALYGTSSIGYLGALLEKTNVDKILKINVLKTDFFQQAAYPTYLLYNPYPQAKIVELDLGNAPADVYDAVSETFLVNDGSGTVNLTIPADQALLVSITPAGGIQSYDRNKLLINGVVVDFNQSAQAYTYGPRIQALAAAESQVEFGQNTTLFAKAQDPDSGTLLTWIWSSTGGSISGTGATTIWQAPAVPGNYEISLIVADAEGNRDTAMLVLQAVPEINKAPQIAALEKSAAVVAPGGSLDLHCLAGDPNLDPLSFQWTATGGSFSGGGNTVSWTAPASQGIYQIQVLVSDDKGLSASASTSVWVKLFDNTPATLIAHYPFTGNANDVSGNQLHGQASGGALIGTDFFGQPARAAQLDGVNDNISVPNAPLLNFQDAITVSCWFKATALPDREVFLLSHGSWQNRWKISITPERKLRWTLNSLTAVGDLDSEVLLSKDSIYHTAVSYDGAHMALYLDGQLQSFRPLSGKIRPAAVPFLMGQMLPGNTEYNFKGTLDEVKIFDRALPPDAVADLYQSSSTGLQAPGKPDMRISMWPNPATEVLHIQVPEGRGPEANLSVSDPLGRLMFSETASPGAVFDINIKHWKPGFYIVSYQYQTAFFQKI
ncbi:MAG: laminin G [Saprospiraceae bacterium]|nr:laminin G [Saprospiraceae bacterium]